MEPRQEQYLLFTDKETEVQKVGLSSRQLQSDRFRPFSLPTLAGSVSTIAHLFGLDLFLIISLRCSSSESRWLHLGWQQLPFWAPYCQPSPLPPSGQSLAFLPDPAHLTPAYLFRLIYCHFSLTGSGPRLTKHARLLTLKAIANEWDSFCLQWVSTFFKCKDAQWSITMISSLIWSYSQTFQAVHHSLSSILESHKRPHLQRPGR